VSGICLSCDSCGAEFVPAPGGGFDGREWHWSAAGVLLAEARAAGWTGQLGRLGYAGGQHYCPSCSDAGRVAEEDLPWPTEEGL
jgi:hypothetical protein